MTWASAGFAVPENILRRVSFPLTKSWMRAFGATTKLGITVPLPLTTNSLKLGLPFSTFTASIALHLWNQILRSVNARNAKRKHARNEKIETEICKKREFRNGKIQEMRNWKRNMQETRNWKRNRMKKSVCSYESVLEREARGCCETRSGELREGRRRSGNGMKKRRHCVLELFGLDAQFRLGIYIYTIFFFFFISLHLSNTNWFCTHF